MVIKACLRCGKEYKSKPSNNRKFCSVGCSSAVSAEKFKARAEDFRQIRLKQLAHEEAEAEKLRALGYTVFSPTVVCDRVVIKDGKVFFVEFKNTGQKLRPGQQAIQELMPDNYLIIYN